MSNETMVVGERTRITGNFVGDEDVRVFGRVDGSISLTQSLIVESSGVIVANVEVNRAVVSGVVVGDITATEMVHITEEGRMVGDINTPRLVLMDGACFKGKVTMGNADSSRPKVKMHTPQFARQFSTQRTVPKPSKLGRHVLKHVPAEIPERKNTPVIARQEKLPKGATPRVQPKAKTSRPPTVAGKKKRVRRK
ncbi:MAG: polymer-forming cytoskeletal protein [Pseudomonadota bacterium]